MADYLCALADEGRSDIYDMNNQSERPGYDNQLTSFTEKWDDGVGNFDSQNHFMFNE